MKYLKNTNDVIYNENNYWVIARDVTQLSKVSNYSGVILVNNTWYNVFIYNEHVRANRRRRNCYPNLSCIMDLRFH